MKGFKVLKSSPFCTIQDSGRYGYSKLGISSSGALDEYAYHFANKLLSNKYNTNSLEILSQGLVLESFTNTYFSITGADFNCKLNNKYIKPWATYSIKIGDIIEFQKRVSGQRAYFCVKDGFLIPKVLNSVSTSLKEKIGGLSNGEMIKRDDFLFCEDSFNYAKRVLQKEYIPKYKNRVRLKVIESYQNDYFSKESKEAFFTNKFTITKDFNSMAFKLNSTPIYPKKSDIISEGIAFGSIQIPSDGQVIILLKERQTIGGYPKFGTLFSLDCFKLAQLRAGDEIEFEKIKIEIAQKKLKDFYSYFSS